jgi:predicted XRE-type DNA-binding protein
MKFTPSSGNVFRDLDLPDPEILEVKAGLVHKITQSLRARRLTQIEAARLLNLRQPKISALLNGNFEGFSIERLLRLLNALDHNVKISVTRARTGAATVRVA